MFGASGIDREPRGRTSCGRAAYRASQADSEAWQSALAAQALPSFHQPELRNIVASKLILDGSPEQIAGWLKTRYPYTETMRMSHETIYSSLFIQARGVLKKVLMDHLGS